MSESLQSMASSYVAKGRTVEFEKMSEYVDKLSEKISTMEKIGQRIQKERIGTRLFVYFHHSLTTFTFFYSLLARSPNHATHSQPMACL